MDLALAILLEVIVAIEETFVTVWMVRCESVRVVFSLLRGMESSTLFFLRAICTGGLVAKRPVGVDDYHYRHGDYLQRGVGPFLQ